MWLIRRRLAELPELISTPIARGRPIYRRRPYAGIDWSADSLLKVAVAEIRSGEQAGLWRLIAASRDQNAENNPVADPSVDQHAKIVVAGPLVGAGKSDINP